MRTSILAASVLALVMLQAGCSQLPQRPNWLTWNSKAASPGLPSPDATIASSEKPPGTKASSKQSSKDEAISAEISRGKLMEASGKPDKARKVYEGVLKQNRDNPAAAHALGVLLDKQGKHADAEQCFLAALQQQPRNPELLNDLGFCYMQQGRLDSAESALVKATTLDAKSSRYRNNLGLVLGHQKRYDDAFEQFSKTGTEAEAFYNMAFVFASQDLPEEAKGCFQQALDVDQTFQPARDALVAFEEFDRLPPEQQKDAAPALANNGVRYVPYIEGGAKSDASPGSGDVKQASATAPLGAMPASRHAGRATRNLQTQSRGMLGGHMQSERNAQSAANAASLPSAR
ncbi:MAG: tetratricopeptide repeat protein [Pirellulaceae bacterium]